MRIGSLFAGIGGFDLAARWMGWTTAWYSEIEPYACRVMAQHFPEAINHGDIRSIDGRAVEPVDVLCGGFPCQDISLAGKGAGIDGKRSGLWSEYARLIEEIRPRWVVAENVSALRSRGLDRVLKDLDEIGYDAEWHCIPASAVGAPHQRDRIWIVAYPNISGGERWAGIYGEARLADPTGAGLEGHRRPAKTVSTHGPGPDTAAGGGAGGVADARGGRRNRSAERYVFPPAGQSPQQRNHPDRRGDPVGRPDAGGDGDGQQGGWWSAEPNVGRVAHGVPKRVDRIRCLGNAVVPFIPYQIFRAIANAESAR
jgi:DNA (cytosine-5)-methyltransferase 1